MLDSLPLPSDASSGRDAANTESDNTDEARCAAWARPGLMSAIRDYAAYGLRIRSALVLPFPAWAGPCDGAPTVEVRLGTTPASLPAGAEKRRGWQAMPGRYLMTAASVARYLVADGRRIVVEPQGGSRADVESLLVGPVLAAVLQQRGITTLHASSVATSAGAVAFLGHRGAGKSSLAGALMQLGYPLMADDVAGVLVEGGELLTVPGFPRLRLVDDSLRSLGAVALASGGSDGKMQVAAQNHHAGRLPLAACYVLDAGTCAGPDECPVAIALVEGAKAFHWLGQHTYRRKRVHAFGKRLAHFQVLTTIAARVPVFHLARSSPRPDLRVLGASVRDHLQALGAAGPAAETS